MTSGVNNYVKVVHGGRVRSTFAFSNSDQKGVTLALDRAHIAAHNWPNSRLVLYIPLSAKVTDPRRHCMGTTLPLTHGQHQYCLGQCTACGLWRTA